MSDANKVGYIDERVTRKLKTLDKRNMILDADVYEEFQCLKCGGTAFHVGKGSYYTSIQCPKCKWILCVHEG